MHANHDVRAATISRAAATAIPNLGRAAGPPGNAPRPHPTLDRHPQDGAPILRDEGWPEEVVEAGASDAEHLEIPRDTQLEEDALRLRRAGRLGACADCAARRDRDPRAEVGEEEAQAAVLCRRRPPRRGLCGGGLDRGLRRPHPQRRRGDAPGRRSAGPAGTEAA